MDAEGKVWNLLTDKRLPPIPVNVTYTSNWRSEYPTGEVYLVSLLVNAKTFILKKAARDWAYQNNGQEPDAIWSTASFDASAWAKGAAPLGDGEARRQTVILYGGDASNESLIACFRRLVTIEDASNIAKYWYRPGCGGARLPWRARSDGT